MICIFIFVHFDTFAKSFVLIVSTREGGPLVSSSKLHKSTLPLFHVGMFPEEKAPKDGGLRSQNFMLSTGTSNCCSQFFSKTCMCNIYIYFCFVYIYIYIHTCTNFSEYMATGNCVDPLYQLPKRRRRRRCRAVPSWRHGDTVGVVAFGGCAWTNPGPSTEKKRLPNLKTLRWKPNKKEGLEDAFFPWYVQFPCYI